MEDLSSDELPQGMPTIVFVSDPSVEGEGIAQVLRGRGYLVADVPLSMLVARVGAQRPRVVLMDGDGEGALETVAELADVSGEPIDLIFFGNEDGVIGSSENALSHGARGFLRRPVDVALLISKLEALTGEPAANEVRRSSAPPPSSASTDHPSRRPGSLPPPSMRDVGSVRSTRPSAAAPRFAPPPSSPIPSLPAVDKSPPTAQVSAELQQVLAHAEERMSGQIAHESVFPSPEEEIEAVLPADVLASLDEPLEDDEIDEPIELPAHGRGTTSTGARVSTAGGTSGTGVAISNARSPITEPPTNAKTAGSRAGPTEARAQEERALLELAPAAPTVAPQLEASVTIAARSMAAPSASSPTAALGLGPSAPPASVLSPGDAPRAMANAIVSRATGALCIESHEGIRRVVFREGDFVTAASGMDGESLLAFVVARGDLSQDAVQTLEGKLPPFGRHAGAALVARGHLRQDQLWSVLREHAESILGRVILQSTGTALMEADPPGRLRGEPSVFERSTGAEVFVEVIRRVIPPEVALARLGGLESRITDGRSADLVSECALDPAITTRLQNAGGMSLRTLVERSPESDIAAVLYALDLLGVVTMVRALGERFSDRSQPSPALFSSDDTLDEDAVRARVRARVHLVDEGDYFALLGVSRDATGYEIRRAFLGLRRAFEPARILTPQVADLSDDVHKIASVLDEAYEILKDNVRRERYRRAIEG